MEYGQKQAKYEEKKYLDKEQDIGWPSSCMKQKSDLESVLDA
tara:strand:+ start:253 stop:378 length:126 start_codon:yes stop_codon:yes gene_type:complete